MPVLEVFSMRLDDGEIPARIRRSRRSRRIMIKVDHRGLEIVSPFNAAKAACIKFAEAHTGWIANQFRKTRFRKIDLAESWVEGSVKIPYRGDYIPLMPSVHERAFALVSNSADSVMAYLPDVTSPYRRTDALRDSLMGWYKSESAKLAETLHVKYRECVKGNMKFVFKDMRSRWGSCSADGKISLNWRLIMTPDEVFEYVFIHEICHMKVSGHGARFWDEVSILCPQWRIRKRWLADNGPSIASFP